MENQRVNFAPSRLLCVFFIPQPTILRQTCKLNNEFSIEQIIRSKILGCGGENFTALRSLKGYLWSLWADLLTLVNPLVDYTDRSVRGRGTALNGSSWGALTNGKASIGRASIIRASIGRPVKNGRYITGQSWMGQYRRGQYRSGQYGMGQYRTGQYWTGPNRTG